MNNITKNNQTSVAVIGAGIVGINCALALQNKGYAVTLLDRQGIGEMCSKNNAGHFATEQVFPLADKKLLWQLPKLVLDPLGAVSLSPRYLPKALPWFMQFFNNMRQSKRDKNTLALKALNKNAIEYYLPLLKEANAEHLLTNKGSLLVFETTNKIQIKKIQQEYLQAGVAVELLSRKQAIKLEPNLHNKVKYALFFTQVAHTIDPFQLSLVLAKLAQSKGMIFRKFNVQKITPNSNQVIINSKTETLSFNHIVLATGAWSKKLCQQLGYKLPLEAERGYSLSLYSDTLATEHLLSRPVASYERKFIITPMANKLRLAGTVEYAGLSTKANYKRASLLYHNAQHILSHLPNNKEISEQDKWMGCRPSLPDSLPVIGKAPQHNNILFAFGHQHLGLTQGAITGKLISQIISNEATDVNLTPFCISRFN